MTISRNMKNDTPLQNLADFENKSLLIVDDDNPFRERLAGAMEKKERVVTRNWSKRVCGVHIQICGQSVP